MQSVRIQLHVGKTGYITSENKIQREVARTPAASIKRLEDKTLHLLTTIGILAGRLPTYS